MFSVSRAYSTSDIIKPPPWSKTGIALILKVYFYGTYTPRGVLLHHLCSNPSAYQVVRAQVT